MKLIYILNFFYNEIRSFKRKFLFYIKFFKDIKLLNLLSIFNLNKIKSEHFKDKNFHKFLKNIRKKYYQKNIINKKKKILVDLVFEHHFEYTVINLLIAKELQKLSNMSVVCLINENDYKNRLISEQFGFKDFIHIKKKNFFIRFFCFIKSINLFRKFKNKNQFFNYKFEGIEIGKITIENFFRFHKNLKNFNEGFYKCLDLSKSFLYFSTFKKIYKENQIKYLVIGENQFLPHRMIFNLALKNKIKVFARLGTARRGIKIRTYNHYSERYSNKEKYSKKLVNYFIDEFSKNKKKIEILHSKQRSLSDIGEESVWANKMPEQKKNRKKYYFAKDKKNILILPHVMIDGLFIAKWNTYNTPLNWFIETLKIIKDIKSVNWIIKPHPSEAAYNTDLNAKNLFLKYTDKNSKHIKLLDSNDNIKNLRDKIFCIITCHGSSGYEYPSIGIPSITTADTKYKNFKCSYEVKTHKEYVSILKNIKNLKKVDKKTITRAKIYWFVRFGTSVNMDILPKMKSQGKMPANFIEEFNKNLISNKSLKGSFYDSFKFQFKNNNRHTINLQLLKNLKLKDFNLKNDI